MAETNGSRYTPGPWRAVKNRTGWGVTAGTENYPTWIATNDVGAEWNNQANARLIAQAPRMVEALRSVLTVWDASRTISEADIRDIRAVLRDALGEE